jgi:hypothetical protein
MALLQVSKIAVENKGGYVFNFSIQYLGTDGTWHTTDWNSGNYPVLQTRTSPELGSIGVPSDALAVTPYGHAVAGTSGQGTPLVAYVPGSGQANYTAKGTTYIGFEIVLNT